MTGVADRPPCQQRPNWLWIGRKGKAGVGVSEADSLTQVTLRRPSRLRWRIIPGTFLTIFAAVGAIGAVLQLGIIAYYNFKYGWISIDPQTPSLNRLAITPGNVSIWQCGIWSVVASGLSAYAWWTGRWRLAWATMLIWFGLAQLGMWLEVSFSKASQ